MSKSPTLAPQAGIETAPVHFARVARKSKRSLKVFGIQNRKADKGGGGLVTKSRRSNSHFTNHEKDFIFTISLNTRDYMITAC